MTSVIDTETRQDVEYGQRGIVAIHVLTPELFLPVSYERDEATRLRAKHADPEGRDLVQDIQPIRVAGQDVIEGVY